MIKNFYELLGVKSDTSVDEIKRAYKTLARSAHPDKGGSGELMGLLSDAYKTLSDPAKRNMYNAKLSASLDSDSMTAKDVMNLQAGDTPPFSEQFRNIHSQLVEQYARIPLTPHVSWSDFKAFESNMYTLEPGIGEAPLQFHDVFTLIREKSRQRTPSAQFDPPKGPLTPLLAVTIFMDFLSGKYNLEQLSSIKSYFIAQIENVKKRNTNLPELSFYQGMLDIMLITDLDPSAPGNPIDHIRKITDFAKTTSDAVFSSVLPLFYNRYFRNLYAYALHVYWKPNSTLLSDVNVQVFDGRKEAKELFEILFDKLSNDEDNESLLSLTRFIKLLYKLDKVINESDVSIKNAHYFREKAFELLDWMPALFGKANKKVLINLFLQIGIKFQQASQKETQATIQMADEQLAQKMYIQCFALGHENASPDEEMYANTETLKYMAAFRFKDEMLAELIPAMQKRSLFIADVFPFFNPNQPNIAFMRQELQLINLLRRLLNGLVNILEYNKTQSNKIIIDHAPSSILYQAYEACLKNWYQEIYNPAVEKKFRRDLMSELLQEKDWVFDDVEQNLKSPWVMVARDSAGWMQPTRALPYSENTKLAKYISINGAEINEETGEIVFKMQEWLSNRPVYEKRFSLFDLEEMLERNISSAIFSLDPVDPDRPYHPFNTMRFGPSRLYETELLNSMLLTDYILKFLTTYQEVQGEYPFGERSIDSMLQHLPGYLRKIIDDYKSSKQHSSALHRFWIEAEQVDITVSDPDKTENKSLRIGMGDMKMIVKKHRMVRDAHGDLKDVGNEDEGWPIYVLTAAEMNALLGSRRRIEGHAMIFIHSEFKLIYWENNHLIHTHIPKDYRETLIRIFKQAKDHEGKITLSTENAHLCYRATRDMAQQSGLSHRFSSEYIFAHEFTTHYDEFAQYLPEFGRLKELSKISTLIRYLDGIHHHYTDQIEALSYILNPTLKTPPTTNSYKNYLILEQNIIKNIESSFHQWRNGLSSRSLLDDNNQRLRKIKEQIGSLNLGSYSSEVDEACNDIYKQAVRGNPHLSSSHIWSQINPKRATYAEQLNKSKREGYHSQLTDIFDKELSVSRATVAQLVNNFLDGNSTPLRDELVKKNKADLYPKLQAQLPKSTINKIEQALDGNAFALQQIAKSVAQDQLLDLKSQKDRVEKAFLDIGLTSQEETMDLDKKCLWVPASVRHEVPSDDRSGLPRYSFFVYGGVSIQPQINVVKGNGSPMGGSSVGGGTLGNSKTYLYQKVSADGSHLKYGITKNPDSRYSSAELGGGNLKIIAEGPRKKMLELERNIHLKMPLGPEERQSGYSRLQEQAGYVFPNPGSSYRK